MSPKQVIVMGKGSLAIRVADWFSRDLDYSLSMIVPVVPEPAWTESFTNWADTNGIPVVRSGDYHDIDDAMRDDYEVDLVFSVFYDKIIKSWFISKCGRILNIHNGPLPRYRGVSPINWALKNNETKHGVTIHEITPGIDEGPIVAQLEYSIYPEFDEVIDVYRRALGYAWSLFEATMPILESIEPRQQNEALATYYDARQNALLAERSSFTKRESIKGA